MKAKQEKYMDLNQFIHNNKGQISWKDCVGLTVEFYYNQKRHEIELLEKINKDYFKIKLDDMVLDKVHTSKITKLMFDNILYEPDYYYKIGNIVNDKIEIIKQLQIERKTSVGSGLCKCKGYLCKCLIDGHGFIISEYDLKSNHGCPVCSNTIVVKGINDIATTTPELIPFFVNIEDAYIHSKYSEEKVLVKCIYCNTIKTMRIADLSKYGRVTCDKCSDGLSYPNKFAHEFFSQLSSQYNYYDSEYSPDWAKPLRYDNYIELLDDRKIIVEMDGGFHYLKDKRFYCKNDSKKDLLANENNIKVIRINCNYNKTSERFSIIKNNMISSLKDYFDLSNINWEKCNEIGLSNRLYEVIHYYKSNAKLGLPEIAKHFNISMETLYNYLYIGEDLGLCQYIRNDPNRIKNSKPIAMYDLDNNLIGIFKSAKQIEQTFPEKNLLGRSIRQYISQNKTYKNYNFKFVTYEEYQAYVA